ncbi:LysR substrate-binding domain-containing protein [Shimwellia blattae]|uniref:Putative malonate utilization transcriptional regulator n=1 Tax=Shimwellia blattae (strain ATCC 29907 / DSM 4481 / JCM 1650 / NBRC 105725 / CDC 9005-74) TaxID=630626 RepID=I2BDH4_SHIBC|nr:LysR substrate-binding domain-containing protein [Shimwellia blattae]AFJ48578.1 putative malonate utilization transcriptional regulator [Shimwellia blattae DSM 4481 = NBRC 105725]GAB81387.1 putative LysR family transcriptional regulator [Shimwellia blattae DSM 4481 = NBRC 105725]VDY66067.1 HTH-type transcriptional regulator gltC [Shimwellia blattae]VEC26838.1 HTH-type transcriptional regulator gltC [Shimwellia blattae]
MKSEINDEVTFRKLEIFMTFMESGNIARAAEAMGISGVSVHRALHSLEEGIRCPLFMHKGRNLVALPAAWSLLESSKEVMALMTRAIEETRKVAGVGQGRLRIGTLYSLTLETIPRLIMGMKLRRPQVEMDLTMGSNQTLLRMLEDNQLDAVLISISAGEIDHAIFEVLPLFHDDIYLAMPVSDKINKRHQADLRQYEQSKFVSLAEGFATYNGFQEAFHIAGFEPQIITRVNDIFSMLSLVQAGVGLTLVPGRMHKMYADSVRMVKLAPEYQMRQQIGMVFARNRERDPNLLALVAEGRMYARDQPENHLAP